MKFLITMGAGEVRNSFFTKAALDELAKHGEVVFNNTGSFALNKQQLIEHLNDIDVLFSGWSTARVDAEVLAAAPKLKIHAHTGGSVANFISKEEYDRGVVVLSGNDVYARSVAEGCLTYTLAALRRIGEYQGAMARGGWRPERDFNQGLIGKRIGIVGLGAISRYYLELLRWFQVDALVFTKYGSEEEIKNLGGRFATLDEIFSTCDVISLHSAMNDENRGQVTAELLSQVRDGALFVNTARAGLVDEPALLRELSKNRFHAVLDVYSQEPLPADSPYRSMPNVTLYPHIAGPTFDMREKVVFELLQDILKIGKGQTPKNAIDYQYAIRMTV